MRRVQLFLLTNWIFRRKAWDAKRGAKIQSRKEHLSSPCYITALRPRAAAWIAGGCRQSDILHRSPPGRKKLLCRQRAELLISHLSLCIIAVSHDPPQAECTQVSDGVKGHHEDGTNRHKTLCSWQSQSWIPEEFKEVTVCTHRRIQTYNRDTLYADRSQFTYRDQTRYELLHLWVWDLGGFLSQAAALCRDQVVVLGADVLVWIVKTSRTGSGRRSGEKKDKNRIILNDPAARCHYTKNFTEPLIILAFHDNLLKSAGRLSDCFL